MQLSRLRRIQHTMPHTNPIDPSHTPASDYRDYGSFEVKACHHTFTFYPSGSDRLEALVDHINNAKRTLDVFYYMFQHDDSGHRVRDALIDVANRGVEVHLIIDDFGSDAPRDFFEPLIEAGGRFSVFSARWNVRYLIRNHQKFAIADNAHVMTGGSNVSDHYFDPPEKNGWCDLGVGIEGPVAQKFTEWFNQISDWIECEGSEFRRLRNLLRTWDPGDGPVQLLLGGPSIQTRNWALEFKRDLAVASRLDLVTAYFTPPGSIRRLIGKLARRGRARLVLAGKSDLDATIAVARLHYKPLLKAGVEIAEFQPCKLHMKLMVIDGISYFGSANLDKRSIRINVELMVRVQDEGLADRLRGLVDHIETASMSVTPEWYAQTATPLARLRWRLAYGLAMTDYWMARRLNR